MSEGSLEQTQIMIKTNSVGFQHLGTQRMKSPTRHSKNEIFKYAQSTGRKKVEQTGRRGIPTQIP